ncbi:hypothetical protein [Psychromonas hadalis]|uniref:hypothetical protein n=1 Tax=Psychromonas hadalis TaxID=211669 RepID=UPI0003B6854A|nr:hypothetical protein [Psychromonas hadalis]
MANKTENNKGLVGAAAGVSTILVCLCQYNLMGLDADSIKALSAMSPIIASGTVTICYWIFLHFNGETIAEKTVNNKVDRAISFLRQQIEEHKGNGLDTTKLEAQLDDAIIAKSKLYK